MDEDVISDLKQFIAATVSQATAHLASKDDLRVEINGLQGRVDGLRGEINRRFDDQDAKLTTIADAHAETLEDHEQRISNLEHRTA